MINVLKHMQLVAAADCAGALDVTDDLQHLLVSFVLKKIYVNLAVNYLNSTLIIASFC